jgi:ABC-type multidrug transport system fused ATPase/permease subunit
VVHCDCIHVLDKGAIIASGTHPQLLASCELYRQLTRHQ